MSAENWAMCPQCKIERGLRFAKMDADLREAYGVVPAEEYLCMRETARKARLKKLEPSLAEFYTIGMHYSIGIASEGNEFYVKYHGKCEVCGFDHKFEHEERIEFEDAEGTSE